MDVREALYAYDKSPTSENKEKLYHLMVDVYPGQRHENDDKESQFKILIQELVQSLVEETYVINNIIPAYLESIKSYWKLDSRLWPLINEVDDMQQKLSTLDIEMYITKYTYDESHSINPYDYYITGIESFKQMYIDKLPDPHAPSIDPITSAIEEVQQMSDYANFYNPDFVNIHELPIRIYSGAVVDVFEEPIPVIVEKRKIKISEPTNVQQGNTNFLSQPYNIVHNKQPKLPSHGPIPVPNTTPGEGTFVDISQPAVKEYNTRQFIAEGKKKATDDVVYMSPEQPKYTVDEALKYGIQAPKNKPLPTIPTYKQDEQIDNINLSDVDDGDTEQYIPIADLHLFQLVDVNNKLVDIVDETANFMDNPGPPPIESVIDTLISKIDAKGKAARNYQVQHWFNVVAQSAAKIKRAYEIYDFKTPSAKYNTYKEAFAIVGDVAKQLKDITYVTKSTNQKEYELYTDTLDITGKMSNYLINTADSGLFNDILNIYQQLLSDKMLNPETVELFIGSLKLSKTILKSVNEVIGEDIIGEVKNKLANDPKIAELDIIKHKSEFLMKFPEFKPYMPDTIITDTAGVLSDKIIEHPDE